MSRTLSRLKSLARWGLLDRLVSTGCPAIHTYAFDFGPITIKGAPGTKDAPVAYCPRRTVLDQLLIEAAAEAGCEVRQGFSVGKLLIEDARVVGIEGASEAGQSVRELARIVVGADGRNSLVAETVKPDGYHERPPLLAIYYAYWGGLPMHGRFETYVRPSRGMAAAETHDGLTMIVAGWPVAEHETLKHDIEGAFQNIIELVPAFAERVRSAKRETRFAGAITPNFFRKPYGPGWALVGDAGYLKDPITAQGILDAFRDAERCANAVDQHLRGALAFETAMSEFQRDRDKALPMYDLTCELAKLEPPPPDLERLLGAVHGNQKAMDAFARMNAGTMSPADFFAPSHVETIFAPR